MPTGTIWHRLMRWFNPVRAWREVRHDPEGRQRFAAALAVGVFISNFPVYGIHTILAFWAAKKFKLHPVPVVVGSHLSTPPLTAPLIVISIAVGHLVLHGQWPGLGAYHQNRGRIISGCCTRCCGSSSSAAWCSARRRRR